MGKHTLVKLGVEGAANKYKENASTVGVTNYSNAVTTYGYEDWLNAVRVQAYITAREHELWQSQNTPAEQRVLQNINNMRLYGKVVRAIKEKTAYDNLAAEAANLPDNARALLAQIRGGVPAPSRRATSKLAAQGI